MTDFDPARVIGDISLQTRFFGPQTERPGSFWRCISTVYLL